jgi:hypothetical protein
MRSLVVLLVSLAVGSTAHATTVVPASKIESRRVAGETQIVPDDATRAAIGKAGRRVVGVFKMCIDTAGAVSRVDRLKSTGFAAYDRKLRGAMTTWRYRPYLVGGKAVPVCAAITFIYSQRPPPPPPVKITT